MTTAKKVVLDALALAKAGQIDSLLHEDFISHNPRVEHDPETTSGRDAFAAFFRGPAGQALLAADTTVIRVIADDDLVAVHNRVTYPDGRDLAIVDIFRVQDGRIAEHWDVVQPVPDNPANPHGMF